MQAWKSLLLLVMMTTSFQLCNGPSNFQILLNEVKLEQFLPFIEVSMTVDQSSFPVNLGGYGLFIIQYHLRTLRRKVKSPAILQLKGVVDFSNTVIPNDQHLGVVDLSKVTSTTELPNNIKLSSQNWKIYGFIPEVLDIENNNFVGIFLTYSPKSLFNEGFLPGSKYFTEEHLAYINQHIVDYLIVQHNDFQESMQPLQNIIF